MFRSANNGTAWTALSHDFVIDVNALAVIGNRLYAGTAGGGILLSADEGDTWTAVNSGLSNFGVEVLTASGTNLFAGTGGGGVFLSTDYALSWTPWNVGLLGANVLSLSVLGNNLFAGTAGSSAFISTNEGSNWSHANAGLLGNFVTSFAVLDSSLYAGTLTGVWMSTDHGSSWQSVSNLPVDQTVLSLMAKGTQLFAGTSSGLFLSIDGGGSWTAVNTGLPNDQITSLAVNGDNLFAGTNSGKVYSSLDNGSSWASVDIGLINSRVTCFAFDSSKVFVGTGGDGAFVLGNNGSSWEAASYGLTDPNVTSLIVSGSKLFAGTFSGIFRSNDNGQTWDQEGLTGIHINALLEHDGILLAGTYVGLFYQALASFPEITSFTPSIGFIGSTVTITGMNYSASQAVDTVLFNGASAAITQATSTSLIVTVPAGATTGRIKVSVGDESTTSLTNFTVMSLSPPVADAASFASSSGLKANWNSVKNAVAYELDISTDNFNTFLTGYQSAPEIDTTVIITSLTAGTYYQYRVRATSPFGKSLDSNVITVATIPAAPLSRNPIDITTTGFEANWNRVKGATGYQLDVSTDNFSTFLSGYNSITVNDTVKMVTELAAKESYQYRVRAQNVSGISDNSNVILYVITGDITSPSNVTLYPNPVDGTLQITGLIGVVDKSQVLDATGRTGSITLEMDGNNYLAHVQNLSSGFYYLQVCTQTKVHYLRFIKK